MFKIKYYKKTKFLVSKWVVDHYLNLAIFNTILVIFVLLNNAKYFDPYWLITVNTIVFISLILTIFLLGAGSKTLFLITTFFIIISGFMRVLGIVVWAERISIYVYQSFFLGFLLLLFDYFAYYNKKLSYGKDKYN